MSRVLLPLVLGALLGGAAVYVSNRLGTGTESESYAPEASGASIREFATAAPARRDEAGGRVSDNVIAASASDGFEPGSLLARAAAEPETVLDELAELSPPARQREAALAVLAALGNNDAGISRVAAMLPQADRMSFRIDALAARAETDPVSALLGALALDVGMARRLAIPRIAAIAARLDPSNALAQASLIGDRELESLYLTSIAGAWAELDAPATLAWLQTAVPSKLSAEAAAEALDAIAASDQNLLLESLDGLSPALRPAARRAAILGLAERDLQTALAEIESLGPGRDRADLESALAERYALENPEAAVAWAKTRPDSWTALEGALRGAAAIDYDKAVDLLMQVLETEPIWPAFALIESGAGDFSQVADRLLASNVPDRATKVQQLMVRWPQVDAEAALEWALANVDSLEQGWLGLLTVDGGREYPELAIAALDRIPPDLRGDWIAGVAGGIAAADADRALAFLEQHRGEPGYGEGLAYIVGSMASSDPAAAAALVERTGARAAGQVGWAWARQDPVAAANWVASLDDPEMLRDGVVSLAANWARADSDAAIGWLLGLPDSPARDYGLQMSVQTATAATGVLDERALNAIGDDRIRERTAVGAISALGRSDPDEARRLVDEHLEDPSARQEALRRIAEQRGGTGIVSMLSSSIDVPR